MAVSFPLCPDIDPSDLDKPGPKPHSANAKRSLDPLAPKSKEALTLVSQRTSTGWQSWTGPCSRNDPNHTPLFKLGSFAGEGGGRSQTLQSWVIPLSLRKDLDKGGAGG